MNQKLIKGHHVSLIVLTVICGILMIIDSTLVSIYLSSNNIPSHKINILIVFSFVIFFSLSNYFFLRYSKLGTTIKQHELLRKINIVTKYIILNQGVISVLLIYIMIEIMNSGSYHLFFISVIIYLSHISSIVFLSLLTYLFINWFLTSRNLVVLIYALAFGAISISIVISIIYLTIDISLYDPVVKLKTMNSTISEYLQYEENLFILGSIYTYISIFAFLAIWVSSVILLKAYAVRIGKILYWIIVSLPVIFFLFPFVSDRIGILDGLFIEFGQTFILWYYILFSPYKQIGGMLFGIVFLLISSQIKRMNLRVLVNSAGIGMILLFGSSVLHGLIYLVSPPFGIVTISYMGLASYMLLIGIFSTAKELSRDSEIRKELYKMAEDQLNLLRNISTADLVKTSENMIRIAKNKIDIDDYQPTQTIDDSDYKEFLKEVVKELSSIKQGN